VRTDEQPPLVKFAAPFGILEARGDRMLPVTVRNVEAKLAAQLSSQLASHGAAAASPCSCASRQQRRHRLAAQGSRAAR
jgi:hypothetical protein